MLRVYKEHLQKLLNLFPCAVILGPRQCGKTTLLGEIAEGWKKYDLERKSDYDIIAANPEIFLKNNPDKVAIDEVQLLPALFPALRVAIDEDREKRGRFLLTGSSSPALLKSVSESLAGRSATLEMAPLSVEEVEQDFTGRFFDALKNGRNLRESLPAIPPKRAVGTIFRYWLEGGFPEPWVRNNPEFHNLWMEEFEKTYIERDISRLFPGLNRDKFRLFVGLLANLSGSIINYSDVARSLGVSAPTVRDYVAIAEGTFLWRHLPSFEKNAVKRVSRHPKGYLRDTGLLHHLLRIRTMDALLSHPKMGHSWEGMVIEQILRGLEGRGISCGSYFYRTGAGAEIDLILEGDFGLLPVEIKYHSAVTGHEFRSLEAFVQERGLELGVVINNNPRVEWLKDKILGIPFTAI